MNAQGASRRLLWRGLVIVLFLALVVPAHAGRRDSRTRRDDTSRTTALDTILASFEKLAVTSSTGDINPTSAPVVDDDFAGLELLAIGDDPMLATEVSKVDYADLELRDLVNAPAANKVAKGRKVVVAVLDAGFVLDHPALATRVLPDGWDFVDNDPDPVDMGNGIDEDGDGWVDRAVGHGTMVAAMVLNAAPLARILPLRVRDDEGRGGDKAVVAAIEYAVEYGAHVINLSINSDVYDNENVWWAVEDAKARGVVVVASAGNDGLPYLPMKSVLVANLIVGAVDRADVVAPFSNYTTGYTFMASMVFAPGVDLLGPMVGEGYYTRGLWSGTSFATGVVSGAVALVKELHPDWDPKTVEMAVAKSTVPVRLPSGKALTSAGRVDLLQVVEK